MRVFVLHFQLSLIELIYRDCWEVELMENLQILIQRQNSLAKRISIATSRVELLPKGFERDQIVAKILIQRQELKAIKNKISIQKRLINTNSVEIDPRKIIRFPIERSRLRA